MKNRQTQSHKLRPSAGRTQPRETRLKKMQELVTAATFPIGAKGYGGQCVVVEGRYIITAAHCLDFPQEDVMRFFTRLAADDPGRMLNRVWGNQGEVPAATLAFEPLSDVAVLGSPDAQLLYRLSTVYDSFCDRIRPLKLLRERPERFKEFPVWILTHTKQWVDGMATYYTESGFAYKTRTEILCGTSGGPIVNERGELVGVVSHGTNSPDSHGLYTSSAPLIPLALPAWVLRRGPGS